MAESRPNDHLHTLMYNLTASGAAWAGGSTNYDSDAQDFFNRVTSNGGQLSSTGYEEATTKAKLNAVFVKAKDLGLWNSLIDFGLYMGVGNVSGALVKLKSTLNVPLIINNGFVSADYAPTGAALGFKGDGSTKYLDLDINNVQIPQDDFSMGVLVSEVSAPLTTLRGWMGGGSTGIGATHIFKESSGLVGMRCRSGTTFSTAPDVSSTAAKGVWGMSRPSSSNVSVIGPTGASISRAIASNGVVTNIMTVLARGGGDRSFETIAAHWVGSNVNLVNMRTLLTDAATSFGFVP